MTSLLSGADAGGTWSEITSSGAFNTSTAEFDASGLIAGTYTFRYSFPNDFATFNVVVSNQFEAGANGTTTSCNS